MTTEATSQTQDTASSEADLNALLSGASPTSGSSAESSESEESAAETETAGEETRSEEAAEEAGEGEGSEEDAGTEEADEGEPEEESEFSLTENDRDYSDAAYKKAADHYGKTNRIQLNPEDPAHRVLLKEIMDRGEALKRQAIEREKAKAEGNDEKPPARAEETQSAPVKLTPEQIQAFIKNASEVAKARIIPEVSLHVANSFIKSLPWDIPEDFKLTQEQADRFTTALSEMFWIQLEDALPALQGAIRGNLSQDPVFGRVESMAIREAAFERLDNLTDKTTGRPLFPQIEQLAESGALRRVIQANPWIKNITVGRDPVANEAARIEAAYKIARGEQVNPETVQRAVETGKKQEADRAKKIAAGRATPGKPKGEIGKGTPKDQQVVSELVSAGGSKFSAALARDAVRSQR